MAGINTARVILGGVVAGLIVFVAEGILGTFYQPQMEAALAEANLSLETSASTLLLVVLSTVLSGVGAVFLYACALPRFGSGLRTVAVITLAIFLGSYVPSLIAYHLIGLYPPSLLILWGVVGFIEMLVALRVGAWIYRE